MGRFIGLVTTDELNGATGSISFGDLRERVQEVVAAGVPDEARLVSRFEPEFLRDTIGFIVEEDLTQATSADLLARLAGADVPPEDHAAILAEISARLGEDKGDKP